MDKIKAVNQAYDLEQYLKHATNSVAWLINSRPHDREENGKLFTRLIRVHGKTCKRLVRRIGACKPQPDGPVWQDYPVTWNDVICESRSPGVF